jgi:RND family efflux transporter MFP subunit
MLMNKNSVIRFLLTAAIFGLAIVLGISLWTHYMHSPWTRDGRVKADVINIAPDVSGVVIAVNVHDNQFVHKGDVLLTIDPARYRLALSQAEAALSGRKIEFGTRREEAARRANLGGMVISEESQNTSVSQAAGAGAQYQEAEIARDVAQLNLSRTDVRAPVDGYISNLNVHPGDYASIGKPALAVIDSHSFWVYGYFEETKLPLLHEGDPATIRLMSGGRELKGHVESLSRGITDRDNATGRELLADVNPTFSWVRLAQRIPVRIQLDEVPKDVFLAAGMTCTVIIKPRG